MFLKSDLPIWNCTGRVRHEGSVFIQLHTAKIFYTSPPKYIQSSPSHDRVNTAFQFSPRL